MAFNTLSFLFLFFPVALLLHTLVPAKVRNILLLPVSLIFFAWGSAQYLLLLILSILFNYFSALQIAHQKQQGQLSRAKLVLISTVVINLLLLGFFKYRGFLVENINALLRTEITIRQIPMPLGVSFFTFSILSFLFDVYRDKVSSPGSILDFSLYVSFFPKLVSGPIVSYTDFSAQLTDRKLSLAKLGDGCRLFLIGLAKKVLLSDMIGKTFNALTALGSDEISVVSAWLGAVSYTLMLYFDFSGYSDMAIGLGQMFGFDFKRNFDYPYLSAGVSEFWRRWHISLGAWFRDYVYIPLGGSREGTAKTIRNILIVWLLTGIWHGASWNFIFWGIYYGGLLLLEKFVLKNILNKIPAAVKVPFTLLLVVIGWVFFFSPDLGSAFMWLGKMFGIGSAGFMDMNARYYLGSSWLILLIGTFAAYPLAARLGCNVYRSGKGTLLSVLWFGLLLLLCIAATTSSTYSSFLYFQF